MNVTKPKKSYKSKVYSVRWDNEKMAFLQSREKNLETGQEIADFLMNNYWWQNKIPHVTAKEAPPLEMKIQDLTKPTNEIKPFEQPKANYVAKVEPKPEMIPMGSFEVLKAKILKTETVKQIEAVMKEVKAALLNGKQKLMLEQVAKEHSKDFYNE